MLRAAQNCTQHSPAGGTRWHLYFHCLLRKKSQTTILHKIMNTPKPKLDLFNEVSFLTSKKCRTSTPSLRPPKPPTKSTQRFCNASFKKIDQRKTGRFYTEFTNITKIGAGNFAVVYKAQSLKDGIYYAIKRTSEKYTSKADRLRKLQEVRNLEIIPRHPNIIRFFDYWEDDEGYLYIQTELCECSINQLVERSPENKLPEKKVWGFLVDLLLGIKHLHDNDLLHLDIKPDNILVSFDGILKLADFGNLCDVKKQNNSLLMGGDSLDESIIEKSQESDTVEEGDSKYLASETMQGKFTPAADIFSIGITIFEIATGMDLPTYGTVYHQLRHNAIEDLYFTGLSKDLIQLIRYMMEENYKRRPKADDILNLDKVKKHARRRKLKTKVYPAKEEFSHAKHSNNNDSDKFDASTNFDIISNGYDSEESFSTSRARPQNLLSLFDQISDEE